MNYIPVPPLKLPNDLDVVKNATAIKVGFGEYDRSYLSLDVNLMNSGKQISHWVSLLDCY